jgi:hypothetical protein
MRDVAGERVVTVYRVTTIAPASCIPNQPLARRSGVRLATIAVFRNRMLRERLPNPAMTLRHKFAKNPEEKCHRAQKIRLMRNSPSE